MDKPSNVLPPSLFSLQILLRIQDAASPSGALLESEAGCDTVTRSAAPRGERAGGQQGWLGTRPQGGSCHVPPTRPSRPHQSGCKRYPSRRNPSSKSSSVSRSSVMRQKPLAVLAGGSAQSWLPTAGSQHPFQTADAVIPSWFSEANEHCFLFLSPFRASLRSFITLCPASTGHEAELLSHFISRVCL